MFVKSESKQYPGFYKIPGYSNYVISPKGEVINTVTGNKMSPFKMSNGYRGIHTLYSDNGKKVALQHRLMALAFIDPNGRDTSVLQVNHINGNKACNVIENLEWVTPQENDIHAGRTGLSPKCLPIDVRDHLTGETWYFNSFIECARHFKVSKDIIRNRLLTCQGGARVFPEWRQYRIHSDAAWPTKCFHKPFGRCVPIEIKDLKTGTVTKYNAMYKAADALGTSLGVLFSRMHQTHQPIFPGLKQVRFSTDNEWRKSPDAMMESFTSRGSRAVAVYDTVKQETKYYKSCAEAANACGILRSTLCERLRSDGKTVFSDGRTYRYFTDTAQSAASVSWQ